MPQFRIDAAHLDPLAVSIDVTEQSGTHIGLENEQGDMVLIHIDQIDELTHLLNFHQAAMRRSLKNRVPDPNGSIYDKREPLTLGEE